MQEDCWSAKYDFFAVGVVMTMVVVIMAMVMPMIMAVVVMVMPMIMAVVVVTIVIPIIFFIRNADNVIALFDGHIEGGGGSCGGGGCGCGCR